jgi:cobaltochelatase CobT
MVEVAHSRDKADAQAAWGRWHVPSASTLFTEQEWPWYALLERARVETMAGRHLPGMHCNLENLDALAPDAGPQRYLYKSARQMFDGSAGDDLSRVFTIKPDASSAMMRTLNWLRRSTRVEQLRQRHAEVAALWFPLLSQANDCLEHGQLFAEMIAPLVRACAKAFAAEPVPPGWARQPGSGPEHVTLDLAAKEKQTRHKPGTSITFVDEAASTGYRIFSQAWDEELSAHLLLAQFDTAPVEIEPIDTTQARRLAHRLMRQLSASRLRRWRFDQEEGVVDPKRLAALCMGLSDTRVFRQESAAPVPQACVTLLLDQSGSMNGRPQRLTQQAVDLAVHALEACGVRCEVLGYTTRFAGHNPLLQAWEVAGRPHHPGRLNALRHLVYKTPSQLWRRCRSDFHRLSGHLKGAENIDGEALHWAAQRLARQPEPRKVLVVFSDGCPYDEATVSVHGRAFLEDHLRTVIARIEASPIHLAAIGSGQDVGRFYRRALTLRGSDNVSQVLFSHLADLLSQPVEPVRYR